MSARSTFIHLAARAGILFGALFLVSVLLAAIPGHRAPAVPVQDAPQSSSSPSQESQPMDHSNMSGMDMDDAKANEAHAVHDMTPGHMDAHNLHVHMTADASRNSRGRRARQRDRHAASLRHREIQGLHVASTTGYKIFLPDLPQPEYHFTNYWNGFLEAFTFDPAPRLPSSTKRLQPVTNLLAPCTTMPKRALKDQSRPRPLSVHVAFAHQPMHAPEGAIPEHELD